MKKLYALALTLVPLYMNAQIIDIPDPVFKNVLVTALCADLNNDGVYESDVDTNDNNEIDLSEALAVIRLNVSSKLLTSLAGINNFTNLIYLDFHFNQVSDIDLAGMNAIITINCTGNLLTAINFDNVPNLISFHGSSNLFTSLDFSHTKAIQTDVGENPNLTYINLRNGYDSSAHWGFGLAGSIYTLFHLPMLEAICLDDYEIDILQNYYINSDNFPVPVLTSYCSFSPGGIYYIIAGSNKYDTNGNGCDASDPVYANMKFSLSNSATQGTFIAPASGNYSIPVAAGITTAVPILENPTYFTVFPSAATVNFPADASPATNNFCVTSNGIHHDVETTLVPKTALRPGFDANYEIIYTNKGTHPESGTVSFSYDELTSDFIFAAPGFSNAAPNVKFWNYSNLQPFETRVIELTINTNTPQQVPPVNGGDHLVFGSDITPLTNDEVVTDNHSEINQTVVNALDPNAKVCLEGETVTPNMAGKYIHYVIHFENSGTANAQNIVVKDMIDTSKFDLTTLIPLNGSTSFYTKINGNKVEFIFENINLPFDDANNDGYIAFKIKTKPELVVGDSFSNAASIYFDYNFPVVTNTATTTIAALAVSDFEFADYFTLYPNPAGEVLNIQPKKQTAISSVSIYNVLGQLVLVNTNFGKGGSIDVSALKTGNYFIRVNSGKGTSNAKFIKK